MLSPSPSRGDRPGDEVGRPGTRIRWEENGRSTEELRIIGSRLVRIRIKGRFLEGSGMLREREEGEIK